MGELEREDRGSRGLLMMGVLKFKRERRTGLMCGWEEEEAEEEEGGSV